VVIEVSSNALGPEIQQAEIQATLGWKAEAKANRTAQGEINLRLRLIGKGAG